MEQEAAPTTHPASWRPCEPGKTPTSGSFVQMEKVEKLRQKQTLKLGAKRLPMQT